VIAPIIPAHRRQRQKDREFELAWATEQDPILKRDVLLPQRAFFSRKLIFLTECLLNAGHSSKGFREMNSLDSQSSSADRSYY
jgi:hypothetical protein